MRPTNEAEAQPLPAAPDANNTPLAGDADAPSPHHPNEGAVPAAQPVRGGGWLILD